MRDVAGNEDEIERAFAGDLVSNVDVAAPCVLDVRNFHGEQCPPDPAFAQRPRKVGRTEHCANRVDDPGLLFTASPLTLA